MEGEEECDEEEGFGVELYYFGRGSEGEGRKGGRE